MRVRDVRRVVEELDRLRFELMGASPTGFQLEHARAEMPGSKKQKPDEYRQAVASEVRYARLALLTKLMGMLSPKEQLAVDCLCRPTDIETYTRLARNEELRDLFLPIDETKSDSTTTPEEDAPGGRKLCNAIKGDGTRCMNPRTPGGARCNIRSHWQQQVPAKTQVTRFGEEIVQKAEREELYPTQERHLDLGDLEQVVTAPGARIRLRTPEEIEAFLYQRQAMQPGAYEEWSLVRGKRWVYPKPHEAAAKMNEWMGWRACRIKGQYGIELPWMPITGRQIVHVVERAGDKWKADIVRELLD